MKFTLTYDGSLPASANKAKNQAKWEIRKVIDPQLRDLWGSHPALIELQRDDNRYFPKHGGAQLRQEHHLYRGKAAIFKDKQPNANSGLIDLCAPIERHGAIFKPLIRETFALHCGLKILFLRKEAPGRVYQGGDIDGRIKTLLDALAMPQHSEQVLQGSDTPIYCLLEDDSMVSGLQVESERLLTGDDLLKDYVRIVVEVDVRVRQAMIYNQLNFAMQESRDLPKPEIEDMLNAGMPLWAAFQLWNEMVRQPDMGAPRWWQRVRSWTPTLQ